MRVASYSRVSTDFEEQLTSFHAQKSYYTDLIMRTPEWTLAGTYADGDFMKIGTHPECRQVSILTGVADKDMEKGTALRVEGHHHSIAGLTPQLLERKTSGDAAPFYLLNGAVLLKDVKKGEAVTLEDVDLSKLEAYKMYMKGLELE